MPDKPVSHDEIQPNCSPLYFHFFQSIAFYDTETEQTCMQSRLLLELRQRPATMLQTRRLCLASCQISEALTYQSMPSHTCGNSPVYSASELLSEHGSQQSIKARIIRVLMIFSDRIRKFHQCSKLSPIVFLLKYLFRFHPITQSSSTALWTTPLVDILSSVFLSMQERVQWWIFLPEDILATSITT